MRGDLVRVREIMDERHPFIYQNELATKARALMRDLGLRILPVTDENGKLLGKVSRRDIMAISSSVSPIRVRGIMTPAKHVASMDDDVSSTIEEMLKADVWHSPVVDFSQIGTYKGVVGLEDFIEPLVKANSTRLQGNVSEIMTRKVVTCSPDDEIDDIWRLMQEKRLAGLPVTKDGKLLGIVTHKDLLESGALLPTFESPKGRFRDSPKISSVMKTNLVSVDPFEKVLTVAKIMISKDIGRIPVKDEKGRLVGIVDREDVAKLLVN